MSDKAIVMYTCLYCGKPHPMMAERESRSDYDLAVDLITYCPQPLVFDDPDSDHTCIAYPSAILKAEDND